MFFYKERKKMEQSLHSFLFFIKERNILFEERKDRPFFWKEKMPNPGWAAPAGGWPMTAAGGRTHRLAACGCWVASAGGWLMTAAGGRAHRLAACGGWAQGWAPDSFPFGTFHSLKRTFHSFPFFFRVFGDLWDPKERSVLFLSFLKNGKEHKERNVLLQRM